MFKNSPRFFLLCLVSLSAFSSKAQFYSVIENSQPKPVVTRSELDADSAHYSDKPHTARDRQNGVTHWVWTEFDKYKSRSLSDSSYIVYARSSAGHKTWSDARRISKMQGDCSDGDNSLKAAAPVAGLNGEVYVCWAGPKGLAFQRSLDSGMTWMPSEKILADIVNGWEQTVDGASMPCIPKMCMDEDGQFKGRLYITWSDEKNGENNKDVFLIYSDDRGENWTDPILVTYRPNHKDQFAPDLHIQPGTGKLFLSFLDKQNYPEQALCDYYLGISSNGGLKFYFYKLNAEPVVLDQVITPVRGLAFVPRTEDAKIVWSQLTPAEKLNIQSVMLTDSSYRAYAQRYTAGHISMETTFTWDPLMKINFELKKDSRVSAYITKPLDPRFAAVKVIADQDFAAGQNTLDVDMKALGLKKGDYIITLYYDNRNNFAWILK